jgi:asparagine synthase (glutamine-hydrolysing)
MCGIVALYAPRAQVAPEEIRRAVASLQHRGPDGQGAWLSPDRRVGLGHARLSIIDLRTGGQPIVSEDGRTVITCNGEFYGYEVLQQELAAAGHRLSTRSDSEVALHLYEDFGPQCLHRLRGEFAFVIWDGVNRTLFAARDRFGIKPLFYTMHNGALYLASEVKALFAAGIPARWDAESFWQAAEQGGHQERTLYDGIRLVPPGHYLIATDQHIQLVRYWDFDYPRAGTGNGKPRSDADYREELRAALEEAVRIRLRADVPVGCYLSGGLDSCSVLGLAARHHPEPIRAFTLTFDRAEYDEEFQAREMAARVGAEFHPIPIRQDDLADAFADAVHQSEAICRNAHGIAKYLLSRAVRDAGYKVVMTGEGSDEIFGGYVHFRRDMLLYNSAALDPETSQALWAEQERLNIVSQGLLMPDGATGPLDDVKRMLGFVPSWMEAFSSLGRKLRSVMTDDYLAMLGERQGYRALLSEIDIPGRLAGRDPVHQSLYLWSKTCLPTYILTMLGDRMEMGHSIEGRVPFLDHRLVEVICAQPVNQKIRGMTEKYVLREAVQDVITDTVYRRQKHPFLAPPASLNPQGKFHAFVQDTLRGPHLAAIPFFDQRKIIGMLDRIDEMDDAGRIANDATLMFVTSACVLQERFRLAA